MYCHVAAVKICTHFDLE